MSWHGLTFEWYEMVEGECVKKTIYLDQIANNGNKQDSFSTPSTIDIALK